MNRSLSYEAACAAPGCKCKVVVCNKPYRESLEIMERCLVMVQDDTQTDNLPFINKEPRFVWYCHECYFKKFGHAPTHKES